MWWWVYGVTCWWGEVAGYNVRLEILVRSDRPRAIQGWAMSWTRKGREREREANGDEVKT